LGHERQVIVVFLRPVSVTCCPLSSLSQSVNVLHVLSIRYIQINNVNCKPSEDSSRVAVDRTGVPPCATNKTSPDQINVMIVIYYNLFEHSGRPSH